MTFAGNWNVVEDLSSIKTGITVHAENNIFYASNLDLGKNIGMKYFALFCQKLMVWTKKSIYI